MRKMGGVSELGKSGKRAGKRRRVQTALLAAALGFGAFAAFAQSEAPREWKNYRGKTVVTGVVDLTKTIEGFPSDAEKPSVVWFRGSDGTPVSYKYALLSADDKKAVDVALDLDSEPTPGATPANSANDATSATGANSANDATPANDANNANSANNGDSRGLRPEAKCVRRAVLVGVSDYAEFNDLRFAGADVELMRSRLVELGFAPEHIVALTTEAGRENTALAPNKRNIERELGRILAESGPDDMIFVMFTGHGFQTDNFGGYKDYVGFAPSDAASSRATDVDFGSTVSLSKLFDDLKNNEAKFKWVLVDACRENLGSGAPSAGGSAASKSLPRGKALRKLEAPSGVAILQSCADGEFSWEFEGHGVFTRTFAESLTEVGDANEDGEVTFLEAAERTIAEVKRETAKRAIYETTQTPYLSGNMTNFVLADVKTAEAKERWLAAVEARESGDYATALEEIDAALALMPEKPEYATEKRTIEAFAEAEKARRKAESEARKAKAEKLLAEAQAAFDREDYTTTISKCDEAARFENLPEISGLRNRAEAEKLLAEAQAAFDRKDYKKAQTKCEEALRLISLPNARALLAKIEEALADDWDAEPEAGTRKSLTVDRITYNFRYCPAGTFTMGSPESESGRDDDETQHRVELTNGFWMLETEVTQAMWKSVMGSNPSLFSSSGIGASKVNGLDTSEFPVERVSWEDCQDFIEKLNSGGYAPQGFQFRLPTEAEWEYACRAGTTGPYAGSSLDSLGWYSGNSGYRTQEVGAKSANAWGLRDMHGNVLEWCEDWYDSKCCEKSNNTQNLINVTPGSSRVVRGGSWFNGARYCRSADRFNGGPTDRRSYYGFRLALVRSSSSR